MDRKQSFRSQKTPRVQPGDPAEEMSKCDQDRAVDGPQGGQDEGVKE